MEFAFIMKKIISSAIMPLSIGFILVFVGLLFLYKNDVKKAKYNITIGFLWIFAISYVPISDILISPLENRYKKLEIIPKNINYILLLGGDMNNRAWEVLRVHHLLPKAKIITSGYAGRGAVPEAIKTAKLLYSIGIPKSSIIIDDTPKDTKEEAIKIKEVLGQKRFILITSAYQMPRAMALFHKEGLHPIAAPTDFKIKDRDSVLSVPGGANLKKTEIVFHEYIGLLWEKMRGQI